MIRGDGARGINGGYRSQAEKVVLPAIPGVIAAEPGIRRRVFKHIVIGFRRIGFKNSGDIKRGGCHRERTHD